MSFLVLLFIFSLLKKSFIFAGFLYAIAIHFKIYPITYGLAIFLFIAFDNEEMKLKSLLKIETLTRLVKFFLTFVVTFASITFYFYKRLGLGLFFIDTFNLF
jgi:phosphatidylinositol glycan class M